jgi:hypothetical protein
MRIMSCEICGSEKAERRTCTGCDGLDHEAWWIRDARDAYVRGDIDLAEFERRVQCALTDPPRPPYAYVIYR